MLKQWIWRHMINGLVQTAVFRHHDLDTVSLLTHCGVGQGCIRPVRCQSDLISQRGSDAPLLGL